LIQDPGLLQFNNHVVTQMSHAPGAVKVVCPLPYSITAQHWFGILRTGTLPVLLTSGDRKHPASNVDIVAANPYCIVRSRDGITRVESAVSGEHSTDLRPALTVLEDYCPIQSDPPHLSHLTFTGGAIGYFGYELLHASNRIDRDLPEAVQIDADDMVMGIYDWLIHIDHERKESVLIIRATTAERESEIKERILRFAKQNAEAVYPGSAPAAFTLTRPFGSNFSKAEYLQRFEQVINYINAGDCYQVNLAQCFTAECAGDSFTAFNQLQDRAQAPFAAYLEDGQRQVLSFSPERFLQVRDRMVVTQPIKGTRPRSADPAQDKANRIQLETSAKDKAENLMIVDLLRNDLGRVCAFGSVAVKNLFETQSFTNVHHLVSTITGTLEQPGDVFKLIAAAFPGGSITGTPKIRAMEIISELETRPRSVYCGVIGWIGFNGNMDSNIAIRTLVRSGNTIHCWGGGGLVADSVGSEEYQETIDKISMFINNL